MSDPLGRASSLQTHAEERLITYAFAVPPELRAQSDRRFAFGENWRKFNASASAEQRAAARASLEQWLGPLEGLSFLDAGAGSGLFASVAEDLGARVRAFDFDPVSEGIEQGDVLDVQFMHRLGRFDVVYSWGVLHHTGDLWGAVANACDAVADGGRLFISVYNDQGWRSDVWRSVKRVYGRVPPRLRPLYVALMLSPIEARALIKALLLRQNYLATWHTPRTRGMSKWRDMVDWIGGYPFEVAKPEEVIAFCQSRGFQIEKLKTQGGSHGCNEFLFRRTSI
jgi:SAM-dependent methyltransferase